jgi:hypothetical protein
VYTGILTRLQTGQPRNQSSIPDKSKRFLSFPKGPDWLWGHPASYSRGNGGTFLGGNGGEHLGCEAGHSHLSDVRNNNEWNMFVACTGTSLLYQILYYGYLAQIANKQETPIFKNIGVYSKNCQMSLISVSIECNFYFQ